MRGCTGGDLNTTTANSRRRTCITSFTVFRCDVKSSVWPTALSFSWTAMSSMTSASASDDVLSASHTPATELPAGRHSYSVCNEAAF